MKSTEEIISTALDADEPDLGADLQTEVEVRQFRFDASHHGLRLDKALADLVPEFSRSYLQQLIDMGLVSVNGVVVQKTSQKIKAHDLGLIELRPTPQSQAFKAEEMALDVVFADEYLLVLNKPAGLVVHPAPGNWNGTLMNGLLGFDAKAFQLPRAGIVHRLDKDTSGLMVVARTRVVMDALVKAIAAREVKRQYLALAHGAWTGSVQKVVNAPVGRDPANRLRMAVVDLAMHMGKTAQTDFALLSNSASNCLVQCTLHTGRTHQIRVHMSSIGHPLVADLVYGGTHVPSMSRQALHAFRLSFTHPITGVSLEFRADLPMDFSNTLSHMGLRYN